MLETLTNVLSAISLTPLDGGMIVVGTVLIFTLYKSLEVAVFRPLLEHVEQREGVTTGALFTASQMRQKAEALRARYDDALFQARVEANRQRSEIVREAKATASSILSEAEAAAAREIQAGRAAIDAQVKSAQTQAETQAQELASKLASQVDNQLTVH